MFSQRGSTLERTFLKKGKKAHEDGEPTTQLCFRDSVLACFEIDFSSANPNFDINRKN